MKCSLPRDFDLTAPGGVERLIAFNRAVFGDVRMEAQGDAPAESAAPVPTPPPAPSPSDPPASADKGFPEDTPVAQMSAEQAANYWKFQARKHESRANARADYDELKARADRLAEIEAENATEHEKAVAAARAEGAAEALRQANERAASSILRAALEGRGRNAEQVEQMIAATNVTAFVRDGDVDTQRIAAHVELVAPAAPAPPPSWPDLGQGKRPNTKTTGTATGREMYQQRRGGKNA